ncbi:response regulator [bacterium]|nr:response regulator [bacterium]
MKTLLIIDTDTARCQWLRAGLESRGFFILGVADSVESAINNITRCHPNVVLVAPRVAKLSGISVTRTIMENYPVPIVLLTDQRNLSVSGEVSWSGATGSFVTPVPPEDSRHQEQMDGLAQKLILMSEVRVVKRRSSSSAGPHYASGRRHIAEQKMVRLSIVPTGSPNRPISHSAAKNTVPRKLSPPVPLNPKFPPSLIGITASTGGPVIIQRILATLPANYPIPIVVIQHLTKGFIDTLVKWLDNSLNLKVVEAHHGDVARPGFVYVVAGQMHAVLSAGLKIQLISRDTYPGHCPSGTVFLNSMAHMLGSQALGIVLTGMGNDGSEGLLSIRERGGLTYAQEESTCTMPSMPHEAIAIGAASYILSPENIGGQLYKFCMTKKP